MEPRPILTAVGAVIVVGVGGLHDLVIGPVDAGHIGELIQFLRVAIHIVHIRAAAQHVVHNGGHLGAGNGGVGPETPVGIAADPAVAGRLSYIPVTVYSFPSSDAVAAIPVQDRLMVFKLSQPLNI